EDIEIVPIIGDVKDKARMRDIIKEHLPTKIYHAAAHKHVTLMEANPHESVKNNVIGTKTVAETAEENNVATFVLASTDQTINQALMRDTIKEHLPTKIYHAAAHKHVPLMEANPHESVKNNVIGTKNVAEAAAENNVATFVLVSTDKAVNPTNVMGASKRIAE